jgi:hypothetical protein
MLLACEIRERSLMGSDHDLVRNRGVAVEFSSRIQEVPEEVLESCLPRYVVDCITWVATRIKASQNRRSRAGVFSPVFVGEPNEIDDLHMLWDARRV